MIKHGLQIFACNASRELACDISNRLGMRPGRIDIARFSNDNLRVQIQENVRERDVFVVQSFTEPVSEHIMELMITLDALRSASAQRITAVIPYYSYARSDKKDAPRISITGRLIADLPGNYLNWFARTGFPPGEIGRLLALMQELDHNGLAALLDPLRNPRLPARK